MHQTLHKKIAFLLTTLFLVSISSSFPSVSAEDTWQWTTPTPGAPNISLPEVTAQETISNELPISSFTLVVNELFPAGSKADMEFIELYNYGNQDVNISGLRLVNKAGKQYVFPNGTTIKAKAHLTLKGEIPLSDTAETVQLLRGTEEVDRLEFADSLPKGGMSAGKYCDVYELRFCEVKRSVATEGFVNALEPLYVEFAPKDAVVQKGNKVSFSSNIAGARIILMQNPESKNPDDSFVYTAPFAVENGETFWYFAQYEGQATIPKKVTFRVDAQQEETQNDIRINEIMVDPLTKRGWVEVYNSGLVAKDMSTMYVDTRARTDTLCTTCAAFVATQKIASKGFMLLELPKVTVTQMLSRQTPIEVRLMKRMDVVDTMTMPLTMMRGQWRSWIATTGAVMLHENPQNTEEWTDIPTPGVQNVHVDFAQLPDLHTVEKAVLAHLVYAQAAYEDQTLLLRGKTLPGYSLIIWGNGKALSEITVPEDGLWNTSFSYEDTKDIPHLLFQLKNEKGEFGIISAPFPIPAYDGADPRQRTVKKIMSAGGSPLQSPVGQVKTPVSVPSSTTSPHSFENIPLLSSMTGVLLSEVPTYYNTTTKEVSMIPGREEVRGPLERVLLTMSHTFARLLALGLSQ